MFAGVKLLVVCAVALLPLGRAEEEYVDAMIEGGANPEAWKVGHVTAWLEELGLLQYRSTFEENKIDGVALLALDQDDLKELEVEALGDRKKMLLSLEKLKVEFKTGETTVAAHLGMAQGASEGVHHYTQGEDMGARGFNDKIAWSNNLTEALALSQKENKPAMLLIHNSACHQCHKLKNIFSGTKYGDEILEVSQDFVMINLQNEEEPTDAEYQPDGEYIPRMFFLDQQGHVVKSLKNTKGSKGYDYFYYRGEDVLREMGRAKKEFTKMAKTTKAATPKHDEL